MSYFRPFPTTLYKFGKETHDTVIQNISAYSDILDHVKENNVTYEKYEILEGERPDTLSLKLYGSTEFYWTFFFMNDHIRKNGFPISTNEVTKWTKKQFNDTVLVTRDLFFDKMLSGDTVVGQTSGTVGVIEQRQLDLGQIVIQGKKSFSTTGEVIQKQGDPTQTVTIQPSDDRSEHLALRHYVNSEGNQVDVDPTVGEPGIYTEVTNLQHYINLNNSNKIIKILKRESVSQIHTLYKKSLLAV
jgi:hypothetical protein